MEGKGRYEDAMRIKRARGIVVATALACIGAWGHAAPAEAQTKGKTNRTEADWVAYDAGTQAVKVKVYKPGDGKETKSLKAGQEVSFNVKAEGTVLTRTTVKVNGKAGKLTDIPAGKRVQVYWIPDEKDASARFARSIDVTFSDEELDERYPDQGAN